MSITHLSVRAYQDGILYGGNKFAELASGLLVGREGFGADKFVLVAFDDLRDLFRVYSIQRLRGLAQAEHLPGRYSAAYNACMEGAFDTPPTVVVVVGIDDIVAGVAKSMCGDCSTVVRVSGHGSRCSLNRQGLPDARVSYLRRMSWLGDAVHLLDVRSILLDIRVPDARLQVTAQQYLSNEHMATMYDRILSTGAVHPRCLALGDSVRQRATAFEASYVGEFRGAYLDAVFGLSPSQFVDLSARVDQLFYSL